MCIAQSEGWCIVVCISYAIYICFAGSTFIIPKGSEKKKISIWCTEAPVLSTPGRNLYARENSPEPNAANSTPVFEFTFYCLFSTSGL